MQPRHVAFVLDQAYGNIVPSLGISMKLIERGHLVSYVVAEGFSSLVRSTGATAIVVDFLNTREKAISELMIENDHEKYRHSDEYLDRRLKEIVEEQTQHTLAQLRRLYVEHGPDLVVHDDSLNECGRALAAELGIPKVRLATQFIEERHLRIFENDQTILVTVPEFFQPKLDYFKSDSRFKFTGFIPEGRNLPFRPWTSPRHTNTTVLVSPTTGIKQQSEFCKSIVEIFRDQPWEVILSISGSHDKISSFDASALGDIPHNITINRDSGNFEIMQSVDLFIGQAGQGGTLEAIYWGLPQILFPPTPYHSLVAHRVSELGLGVFLPISEMSREAVIGHATSLLKDKDTQARIQQARNWMLGGSGADIGANILEECLSEQERCHAPSTSAQ